MNNYLWRMFMQGRLNSSAVIFGDFKFKDIQQEIIKLQELFKDLSVFASISQNQMFTGVPLVSQTIELLLQDTQIDINIASDRIYIEKIVQFDKLGNKMEYNDEEFLEIVQDIQKRLLKHYNISGSRIAYIVNFCKENHNEVKNKIFNDYLYKNSKSFEWGARSAVREDFIINGKKEVINVVTSINFSNEKLKFNMNNNNIEIGGLMYNLDINTVPENIQTRIDDNFISEFYKQALKLVNKIKGGY